MALILNIDTSVTNASVCLARNGEVLKLSENDDQKKHSEWLHPAILSIIKEESLDLPGINAVAVSIGPGSYTGLRLSLSAAKGLCFVLNIPLITIGTLEMMSYAAKDENTDLLCPTIDARRSEIFTAVYNKKQKEVLKPHALILDEKSFDNFLTDNKILFFGTGSKKTQSFILHPNALFKDVKINASALAVLSFEKYKNKQFADLAYTEPLYIKDFHSNTALPIK